RARHGYGSRRRGWRRLRNRTSLPEQLRDRRIALQKRPVERGPAIFIAGIHIRALAEEHAHDLWIRLWGRGRHHQRCDPASALRIRIRAAIENEANSGWSH